MKILDKVKGKEEEVESASEVLAGLVGEKPKTVKTPSYESSLEKIPLSDYFKASYPLIRIRTEEDDRAVKLITESIAKVKGLNNVLLGEYKSTTGLRLSTHEGVLQLNENNTEQVVDGTRPVQAIEVITDRVQDKDDPPIVLMIHNVGFAFRVPQFVQALKDVAIYARLYGCHIILIGADLGIPVSLNSLVTVYDLELPNQDHFYKDFETISKHYKNLIDEEVTDYQLRELAASAVGMTKMQGENAIALSIVSKRKLDPKIIQYEKEQAIKRSEVLEFVSTKESINKLGGWEDYKKWLGRVSNSFTPEAVDYGLKFPKGVIVVGIQGCGKSLAARATSSYLNIPLLKFDMGKLFRSRLGQSESLTRQMTMTAEAVAPAVLWIDEIEKGAGGMASSNNTDGGTTARVMSTILTWMQETTKPIFFFATCNSIDKLPAEVYRRGRFTEIWGVEEPGEEEREQIWSIKIGNKRPDTVGDFNIDELVEHSPMYTGAEIEVAVDEAMYTAFGDEQREFTTDDILTALNDMIPQAITSKIKCDAVRDWMKDKVRMVSTVSEGASRSTEKKWDNLRVIRDSDKEE